MRQAEVGQVKVNVDIQFRIHSTTKTHRLQNMSDIFSVRLWTIGFELKCQSLRYVCQTFRIVWRWQGSPLILSNLGS